MSNETEKASEANDKSGGDKSIVDEESNVESVDDSGAVDEGAHDSVVVGVTSDDGHAESPTEGQDAGEDGVSVEEGPDGKGSKDGDGDGESDLGHS